MSDNSSSANGNSWTILTPEVKESGIESVGSLAEGQGGQVCSEPAQLEMEQTDHSQRSEFTDGLAEHNNGRDAPQVAPLESSEDAAVPHAFHMKEPTLSATPVENLTCLTADPEQQGVSASHSESEPFLGPDTDSFSDSYTHISSPPESTLHPAASQDEEGLSEGEERPELRKTLREESKQEVEVLEEKGNEGDGVRRRKVSLLTPVDHRDDEEEEEGEEEPFRPPQREDDVGFSLNKCIFGAVILLGLGTIFFSGVFMDLDDESDTDVKELKHPELQKEWLNLQSSRDTPAGVQPPEILERLAEKSQKIAVLQAQLQEQEGELKAAQLQVEEGNKERMRREELEMENQRMKGELDKLPALQKELEHESERVKKEGERAQKDLEALPGMQKELELLRAKVTELAQTTDSAKAVPPLSASASPSAGHERELSAIQGRKELKDKKSQDEVKEQMKEWRDGKERKKDRSVKEGKQGKATKDEGKDLKKQKVSPDESKEWRGKGERKEWKGEKEGKRGKKQEDGKRWKDGEENRQFKEDGKRERKENGKRRKDGEETEFKEHGKRERKESGKRWKHGEENEFKKDGKRERKESGKRWKDGEENSEFKKDGKREKKENGKRWKDGEESIDFKKDGKRERKENGKTMERWGRNSEFKKDGKRERKENGKRWKDGEENSEFKKDGKRERKENGKRWKDGEENSEFKKDGKRERKENGKRWKDGEENSEFKKDGTRERKENGKKWKDSEVKRELKEESGKMDWEEDKKWKKEKRWQLDGGRWETKERKHSGDKVKGDKEWTLTDEKEWKNGRQVGSNDKKEWKERNERKKDWKERDEWEEEKERGNPRGEGKARKESAWKGQKDDHKRNGGKKEWKEHEDKHWSGKERERAEGWKEEKKHKGDYQKNGEKWSKKGKSRQSSSEKAPHHSYSDREQSKDHVHNDYWAEQRERIRHFHGSTEECSGLTDCAHAEGLTPVGQQDFEALLLAYLTKLIGPEERASKKEELNKLIGEFFTNGVFVHDQIPFSEFAEDVADILEDMAEGEEDEELEDEMEGFASEAMEKFALPDRGGNEEKRKESGRKRAAG
ncbi:LOW QUALITY PROTEIN: pre-B-cell leukemia homeobox interacting protein 1b [Colossoma macropomum]|uniref:LOW QUALITY PROTEIN: pre-B-cell leukemia homeobox interacting protein 1b n=1 Tax=Colossoma macropomum TaxID=42526 RepID=UPI0018653F10|nr:LOW QUALITY PROTEIN: pre-B-cell leukemia homeobox interacting protein 1b [Colossoma macropomum]